MKASFAEGEMFGASLPTGVDVVLLSNVLHDWDVAECRQLIDRAYAALKRGGISPVVE